jgi:hypothetical protein
MTGGTAHPISSLAAFEHASVPLRRLSGVVRSASTAAPSAAPNTAFVTPVQRSASRVQESARALLIRVRATVSKSSRNEHRRPRCSVPHQGVKHDCELTNAGDQRDLRRLPCRTQTSVVGANGRVPFDCHQRAHVQHEPRPPETLARHKYARISPLSARPLAPRCPGHWKKRERSRSALRKRIANDFNNAILFCNAS